MSAVSGKTAALAGGKLHGDIVGVAVRLYKFLIADYYDEFAYSVRAWVDRVLKVMPHCGADAARQAAIARMQSLYTEHVLPDDLIARWNNGIGHGMCHVLLAGQNPEEERPRLVKLFTEWIINHLLKIDSAPTLTRFFTFRACTDRMFTMHLIGMPTNALIVTSIQPRKDNQTRLTIEDFFPAPRGATVASPYHPDLPAHRRGGGIG